MGRLLLSILAMLGLATPAYAQIDFRSPRAAGKVWEKKIIENNHESRNQGAEANAADAAWEAPLTETDLRATLERNRAEYDRRLGRYGKGHTDRWLDRLARSERLERSANTGTSADSRPD